ncbi:MAG: histidine kinase dimerization/phospho-acceptor domain-containing protein [Pseudomonadota bacterium]
MFFDDRLSTVLRQDGSSEAAKRTQFRQLLDILGNRKFGPAARRDRSLIAAAWLRMDALGRSIPSAERAAMIREPSWRFRSADLAAHLADFEPEVASAALNRAQLSTEDWSALIPRLPVRARGFLRLRRDLPVDVEQLLDQLGVYDRGLPSPAPANEAPGAKSHDEPLDLDPGAVVGDPATPPPLAPLSSAPRETLAPLDPIETGRSEISALVERIAQFKRTREPADHDELTDSERSPRLPLGEVEPASIKRVVSFGFSADAAGRIEWAEADTAPMVIGARLIAAQVLGDDEADTSLERAFRQRQPIRQAIAHLHGAPAISGEWRVDAEPRFSDDGHFTGYVGRFRRPQDDDPETSEAEEEADRIRQLLHELRTPVTAIQGYAEVIQQQLFGPAPHEYRALAAAIAADAAHILAGFEELDRLSQLELGILRLEPGTSDLTGLARKTSAQLSHAMAPRMAGLEITYESDRSVLVPIEEEQAELILWRFMAVLSAGCGPGEKLTARLHSAQDMAIVTCDLPQSLLQASDIFTAEAKAMVTAINAGVFGAGFALRLARAEARGAGGDLVREGQRITLSLPILDPAADTTTGTAPLTPAHDAHSSL